VKYELSKERGGRRWEIEDERGCGRKHAELENTSDLSV
jgi:hypothetical protein